MSKSVKKAIFKQGTGAERKHIRRRIRRSQNSFFRSNLEQVIHGDKVLPDGKTIVNDWEYCDYKIDFEHRKDSWWNKWRNDESFDDEKKKYTRK